MGNPGARPPIQKSSFKIVKIYYNFWLLISINGDFCGGCNLLIIYVKYINLKLEMEIDNRLDN